MHRITSSQKLVMFLVVLNLAVFVVGYFIGQLNDEIEVPKTAVNLNESPPPPIDTEKNVFDDGSVDRCGDYDLSIMGRYAHWNQWVVLEDPKWSPDCRFIVWSVRNTASNDDTKGVGNANDGVFLFTERQGKTEEINFGSDVESVQFLGWRDRKNIGISFIDKKKKAQSNGIYNIVDKKLSYEEKF